MFIKLSVPGNSSGYIHLEATAGPQGYDVYVGGRKVLANVLAESVPGRPDIKYNTLGTAVKFKYMPADIQGDKVVVRLVDPYTANIRVYQVGIQTISPNAPAAPVGVTDTINGNTITVQWLPVAGAALYNIYRDNKLIGTSPTTSFTDALVDTNRAHTYAVSAWHDHYGEGELSISDGPAAACPKANP